MQRFFRFKNGLFIFMGAGFFILLAIGGSILLGQLYITILKGNGNEGLFKTEEVSSRLDSSQNTNQNIKLEAVPVYFLQAGVFSDRQSGQKKVDELKKMGYMAYLCRLAPYKVYLGINLNKEAAMEAKKITDAQNISTYISSVVINGNQILVPKTKKINISEKNLKQFNEWLKLNVALFEIQQFEKVESVQFKDKLVITEEIYQKSIKTLAGNKQLGEWSKSIEEYHKQLNILKENWTEDNYELARLYIMGVTNEYIIWTQSYIDK